LRKKTPPAVCELLQLPGIGPKRVKRLHDRLGVNTVVQLHRAAQQGRVHDVPGFGERTEQRILEATAALLHAPRRFKLIEARTVADDLLGFLRAVPGVEQALAAGSLRRGRDTVGDLDLLVCSAADSPVMDRFAAHPEVRARRSKGPARARVFLKNGMPVDQRAVPAASFGAAAVYFTGSKAHNIALRRLAQEAGLKINEYGVYRGRAPIAGQTEESVYRAVGLPCIPPELREDRGELEAARQGRLPQLVRREDLRGDLHAHTKESDGHDTLEAMVEAARARGLGYLAITEHSQRLTVAKGLDPVRLAKQIDRIERLNATLAGFTLLKGVEVDILEDGSLDLPDSILERLDLVVGAVHHRFDLSRVRQTERLLRAMDHRHFSILAHPSGRLIGERPAMDIDLLRVLRHARQRGCFLELNAHPARLDLDDTACQTAKTEGVKISIASDAHSGLEIDNLRYGVTQARRGWLEAGDVINTRDVDALRALLRPTMA
jgi:DNA polymerase (family 10)